MSRLRGDDIHVGNSLQLRDSADQEKKATEEYIQKAEATARTILNQAKAQASQILKNAEVRALEIIQVGQDHVDAVHQEAYEAGEQKGFEAGLARAEEQTVELLEGAQALVEGAYQAETRVLKGFQKSAAELIKYICEKILHHTLEAEPEAILTMIEGAIESLHITSKVKVVLCAETVENIRKHSLLTEEALQRLSRFELIADPQLGLREIYVLSQEGNFCLTPEKQVAQLLNPIRKKLPLPALEDLPEETLLEAEETAISTEVMAEESLPAESPVAELGIEDPEELL